MSFLDKRPVFKNKEIEKSFKHAEFFFILHNSDCPICLEFYTDPQTLPCGHCFCKLCITLAREFNKNCPVCANFFWIFKPVKFYFTEKIENFILLRRLNSTMVNNKKEGSFYDFPYALEYFQEEDCANTSGKVSLVAKVKGMSIENSIFYQSNDGQLYFLDPIITKDLLTKPVYIYSEIKEKYECFIDYTKFPNLLHIPFGTKIFIVSI